MLVRFFCYATRPRTKKKNVVCSARTNNQLFCHVTRPKNINMKVVSSIVLACMASGCLFDSQTLKNHPSGNPKVL